MTHVLVVEDERSIRMTLEKLLRGEGYSVSTAVDGPDAVSAVRDGGLDVVLLDLGLPQLDGLGVLSAVHGLKDAPPIIVLTAREDMQSVVRAMQLGAYDYLVKPPDIEHLKVVVRRAAQSRETSRTLDAFVSRVTEDLERGAVIGRSPLLREVYKTIGAVSTSRAGVMIQGESGTGKELVAKAIHYSSADRDKPFVAVNCTALSRDLLASELFGHVKGSFTGATGSYVGRFELAGSGTLFLDEIGELAMDLQTNLLRVLQERTFERVGDSRPVKLNARVITATNRDLRAMVKAGLFREDLYYRLKVVEIRLPALRDHMEDLPLLIESLLRKINADLHKQVTHVSPQALAMLSAYHWPGNVRELENALMRAVVLAPSNILEAEFLPMALPPSAPTTSLPQAAAIAAPTEVLPLHEVEKRHIQMALAHTSWNKRRTCALLEISRPTLDRKIDEHSLKRGDSPE